MARKPINTKPGASVYPIRPGVIFRLDQTITKENKILKCELQHHVYIWITGVSEKQKSKTWQHREVRIVRFEVPVEKDKRQFCIDPKRTKMRWETACRLLNKGYTEFKEEVEFQYNVSSWRKFYRVIGYLK